MSVDYKAQAIYDEQIKKITGSSENWQAVLRLAGWMYRYEFDNVVMVYAQRPKSTLVADYDTWKKVDRYVKRGSKGIAIFPSRALEPHMRYVFDISDTGGRNRKLTWDLEGDTLRNYLDFLVADGQMEPFTAEGREEEKNLLKLFTGTNVWGIIRTDFEERTSELLQLAGSRIREVNEKRNGLLQDAASDMEQLIYQSVMYVVGTRCGFDLSLQERDFSQIVNIRDEEIVYRLGSIVCDVSCSVLKNISNTLKTMERQHKLSGERRIAYGSNDNDVSRGERSAVSGYRDAGAELTESGQIRQDGNEISGGERTGKVQDTVPLREAGREDEGSRRGSEQSLRPVDGAVSSEAQAAEPVLYNGDVEVKGAGEDAGRGNRAESGSDEVSLSTDNTLANTEAISADKSTDEELNRELDELNSFGNSREAGYHQASFFDAEFLPLIGGEAAAPKPAHTVQKSGNTYEYRGQKYTYLEPKKEPVVPHEYVVETLLRGSGFENGRTRIRQIFQNEIDAGTRAKLIRKEYGQGGAGWPLEGYGLHGYDTFHGQGIRFQWRDEEGEKEGYLSWKNVEKEIGALILIGQYEPERQRIDELAMDGMREDDIVDADYQELETEDKLVNTADTVIDDFAIPDEPESYESVRKNAEQPEERGVTPAEYEDETAREAEDEVTNDSKLRYITPVDYAKKIAEMDEDFRTALELLVSECSTYSPYRAFLVDIVNSEYLFMPNRLDFLSDVVLGDSEERKGYANNQYGLIEYVLKPYELTVNYKNRFGERVTEQTGYRELYEVLTYMAKQPYFCGQDQLRIYQNQMAGDREKLNPVYRAFLEKQEEIKANREATEERAVKNGWDNGEERATSAQKPTDAAQAGEILQTGEEEQVSIESHSQQSETTDRHNFHYNLWELETGGAKTRFNWNVEAIRTLKQIEEEDRLATEAEQQILSKYAGWGGISQAFDAQNESWKKEYAQLKELLTEEEYTAARATVNNAFYTSPEIAMCINQALVQFGFHGGNVLEPSMGIGNFFGSIPASMQNSSLYGVELDGLSGRIAGQLYQNAHISITGFEKTTYPDNFFDVVVGNVPFGDYKVYDPKYNKYNFRIHDYFIAKALDQVRPGGMVAVITTKGTLDKSNPSIRKYIAQRAELVGAVRLPNTAFKENAGTEVTSDILFLQKRERKIDIEPDWVHLGYTENGIAVNSYFVEHPEMMLGHMEYDTGMYGENSRYTVCVNDDENFNLYEALNTAISGIHAELTDYDRIADGAEEEMKDSDAVIPADPDVRNFTYTVHNGMLYYRENSQMIKQETAKVTEERILAMYEIRQITRELITIQMEGCSEEELAEKQRLLNVRYDKFVEKYGCLTGKANKQAFRDDSDYPLLCSLEEVNEDGEVKKADMFYKQTIKAKAVIEHVETAVEALNISVSEFGTVNLPYMLSIYEPDISDIKENLAKEKGEPAGDITFSETLETDLKRQVLVQELEGLIFCNPNVYNENNPDAGWETADEYLSGNVREKLRTARAAANENPVFAVNVAALEQVQPKDLDASEIEVRIGTTWIEPTDYEQFIYELLNTRRQARAVRSQWGNTGIQVHLNKMSMEWFIENKSMDKHSVAATKTYGTGRMDAYSIFEDTLNLRTVTVRDRIDDGEGKYHYEVNKNETMLAREKQNQMKAKFKEWLFSEPERRAKYVEYYNETFNNSRLREYDGSHLQFPGMNPEIELKPHQKNAVARILLGGNTLLAHCVGAGKSFEMMAACMEQKRLGLANKTMMVVPKPLIGQTASEFLRLYPSANILVTTERDFEKNRRKQFISRIATGDYDCIIISHSQFEKIPISPERKERMLNRQIEEISYAIEDIKEQNGERWTIKQMESQKKKLEEQLKSLTDESRKDDLITFEELGVDSIMVDEAHGFKNLAIFSKMNNVAGISSSGAKKSTDMQLKCQYLSEINNGRGIVFATGTPVSNSMCELYVMQLYLQKEALEQMGIHHFDSWAANFGEVTTALELSVEGSGFRFKSRFNKFVNLSELMNTFREVADVQTQDMLDLDVPALKGGKAQIVESEPDWFVKQVMEEFVKRAERIRGGGVDPSEDNFLKITHEARLLGTDARLLDKDAPENPDGKLNKIAENVYQEYVSGNADGRIGCQLIFSDIGVPKQSWSEAMIRLSETEEQEVSAETQDRETANSSTDLSAGEWNSVYEFDVYNYLKTALVLKGIPAEEIAFVHDAKTDAQRDALFKEMRTGKKKILIGSTDKCGTGVNVQTHLTALHHVDCPWKPSSIEQREGRGIRQGNENEAISVYRYVTKSTFDAYNWGVVENKQRFISQVMTSRTVSRSCEDIDEATLSYAEIKAVATGNPLIREKMEVDNDVQRLKLLKASYDSQRYTLQDNFMIRYPKLIKAATEKLACVKEDIRHRDNELLKGEEFAITIGKFTYTERADGGTQMLEAASRCKSGETSHLGEFKGFELLVEKNFMGTDYLVLRGKTEYKTEFSTSPVGSMVKIENLFNGLHENEEFLKKKLEQYEGDLRASKEQYEKPFEYAGELEEKLARQCELNAQLDLENERNVDAELGEMDKGAEAVVAERSAEYRTESHNRYSR